MCCPFLACTPHITRFTLQPYFSETGLPLREARQAAFEVSEELKTASRTEKRGGAPAAPPRPKLRLTSQEQREAAASVEEEGIHSVDAAAFNSYLGLAQPQALQEQLQQAGRPRQLPLQVDKRRAVGYVLARLAGQHAALQHVLRNVAGALPRVQPKDLLDYHAGAGAAGWAAQETWPGSLRSITAVEPSTTMSQLGTSVAEAITREASGVGANVGEQLRRRTPRVTSMRSLPMFVKGSRMRRRYDVVVASYALSALPTAVERQRVVRDLWDRTGDLLVLVEPGTPLGFTAIREARTMVLTEQNARRASLLASAQASSRSPTPAAEAAVARVASPAGVSGGSAADGAADIALEHKRRGSAVAAAATSASHSGSGFDNNTEVKLRSLGAHVVAPCGHDGTCPMEGRRMWCHFGQRFQPPNFMQRVKLMTRSFQDERFSYVVLRRGPRPPQEAATLSVAPQWAGGALHVARREQAEVERMHLPERVVRQQMLLDRVAAGRLPPATSDASAGLGALLQQLQAELGEAAPGTFSFDGDDYDTANGEEGGDGDGGSSTQDAQHAAGGGAATAVAVAGRAQLAGGRARLFTPAPRPLDPPGAPHSKAATPPSLAVASLPQTNAGPQSGQRQDVDVAASRDSMRQLLEALACALPPTAALSNPSGLDSSPMAARHSRGDVAGGLQPGLGPGTAVAPAAPVVAAAATTLRPPPAGNASSPAADDSNRRQAEASGSSSSSGSSGSAAAAPPPAAAARQHDYAAGSSASSSGSAGSHTDTGGGQAPPPAPGLVVASFEQKFPTYGRGFIDRLMTMDQEGVDWAASDWAAEDADAAAEVGGDAVAAAAAAGVDDPIAEALTFAVAFTDSVASSSASRSNDYVEQHRASAAADEASMSPQEERRRAQAHLYRSVFGIDPSEDGSGGQGLGDEGGEDDDGSTAYRLLSQDGASSAEELGEGEQDEGEEGDGALPTSSSLWEDPRLARLAAQSSLRWPRIYRQPRRRGGHTILDLCVPVPPAEEGQAEAGRLERHVVSRSDMKGWMGRPAYQLARRVGWGDLWPAYYGNTRKKVVV